VDISASAFAGAFKSELKTSDTLTWTNKFNASSTKQVGQTASLSVTGPTTADNYTGPVEFDVFQDTIYGSFMFNFVPPPTFALSVTPTVTKAHVGGCSTFTVFTSALVSTFNSNVALSLSGLPADAFVSFSPASITGAGSSTLTACTSSTTAVGNYTLTITGTTGAETHSVSALLKVR
jgi:hypothetical protein